MTETLCELTAETLKELGISLVGHRRKLLAAIAALATSPASSDGNRDRDSGTEIDVADVVN